MWAAVTTCHDFWRSWRRRYHLTPVSCSSLIMIPRRGISNCSHYRTPADICTSGRTKTNKSISRPDPSLQMPVPFTSCPSKSICYWKIQKTTTCFLFTWQKITEGKTGKKNIDLFGTEHCEKVSIAAATLPEQGMFPLPTPFVANAVFLHISNDFLCAFFSHT